MVTLIHYVARKSFVFHINEREVVDRKSVWLEKLKLLDPDLGYKMER